MTEQISQIDYWLKYDKTTDAYVLKTVKPGRPTDYHGFVATILCAEFVQRQLGKAKPPKWIRFRLTSTWSRGCKEMRSDGGAGFGRKVHYNGESWWQHHRREDIYPALFHDMLTMPTTFYFKLWEWK